MAQFYVPRYDTGSGNPWGSAAAAYGNELDRLGALQQQGMQDRSQLPMTLYQSFMKGYQDKMAMDQAAQQAEMQQQEFDRRNKMQELAQQKADEAEAFRRDQLAQQAKIRSVAGLSSAQREVAQDYVPELRDSYKNQIKANLMLGGMGETEADAAAEAHLPKITSQKVDIPVAPEGDTSTPGWGFDIGGQGVQVQPGEAAQGWDIGIETPSDTYRGSRIVEAQRKAQLDAIKADQFAQAQAERERSNQAREDAMNRRIDQAMTIASLRGAGGGREKPAKGFRYAADGTQEPIPGGPADMKFKQEYAEAVNKTGNLESNLGSFRDLANEIKNDGNLSNVLGPLGYLRSMVPGSPELATRNKIEQLVSKQVISMIEGMKSSKTGATGFGQLSDQEGQYLKSSLAKLNTMLSLPEFAKQLDNIINYANGIIDRNRARMKMVYGGGQGDEQTANPGGGSFKVQAGGRTYTFKTQQDADNFKRDAGIQ